MADRDALTSRDALTARVRRLAAAMGLLQDEALYPGGAGL
jgi:hypothetical protein